MRHRRKIGPDWVVVPHTRCLRGVEGEVYRSHLVLGLLGGREGACILGQDMVAAGAGGMGSAMALGDEEGILDWEGSLEEDKRPEEQEEGDDCSSSGVRDCRSRDTAFEELGRMVDTEAL